MTINAPAQADAQLHVDQRVIDITGSSPAPSPATSPAPSPAPCELNAPPRARLLQAIAEWSSHPTATPVWVIQGLAGSGRSHILTHAREELARRGFAVVDIGMVSTMRLGLVKALTRIVGDLEITPANRALIEAIERELSELSLRVRPVARNGTLGPSESADDTNWKLRGILERVAANPDIAPRGIVFTVDNLHQAPAADAASVLEAFMSTPTRGRLRLVATSLPGLTKDLASLSRVAEHVVTTTLLPLTRNELTEMLARELDGNVRVTHDAVTRIGRQSLGNPALARIHLRYARRMPGKTTITVDDVDAGSGAAQTALLDSFYRPRLGQLDGEQLRYLSVLAGFGDHGASWAEVERLLLPTWRNDRAAPKPDVTRESLLRRGLVYVDGNRLHLSLPALGHFLRTNISSVLENAS